MRVMALRRAVGVARSVGGHVSKLPRCDLGLDVQKALLSDDTPPRAPGAPPQPV